ncbi:MAG: hypothetical protein ABSC91_03995 [Candidatus Bathyarchaeia archaeon]|jgi:hypothetical protein
MKDWEKLLKEAGHTLEDVDKAFTSKIEELKGKGTVKEKRPLGGHIETDVGKFVPMRASDYPLKMYVFQEMSKGQYVRIGYYVVSLKKLKKEGRLQIVWGQSNPTFPKKDFFMLLRKAQDEGIIDMYKQ